MPCRRISNNLCSYSILKEVENNFLLLKRSLYSVSFFQRVKLGKGKNRKSNFTAENLTDITYNQVIKVNINSNNPFDVSLIGWDEMEFYLYGFPPKNTLSQSNHKKNVT